MNHDIHMMAKTIYGEARGEYGTLTGGLASLIAVGNVIYNRVQKGRWYGKTIEQVCLKPWQFSCWNISDINYQVVTQDKIDDPLFRRCLQVSEGVLTTWPDLTKGATHYHTQGIPAPIWARGIKPQVKIGQHLFYTLD